MYCKNCGFKNEDSAVFCANCGASIEIEENTSVLVEETQDNQVEYFDAPQEYQQEQYVDIQSSYSVPTYNNEYYSTPVYNAYDNSANEPQEKVNKTPGILSVVFGSIGLALSVGGCCCLIGGVWGMMVIVFSDLVALAFGITGIILASSSNKKAKAAGTKNGAATAGLILSIITTVIAAPSMILAALCALGLFGVAGLAGLGALTDSYYYY